MRLFTLLILLAFPQACEAVDPNDWAQYNYDNRGWRFNHAERTLGPDNVGKLRLKWHFNEAPDGTKLGAVNGTPIVVNGSVYFGTADTPRLFKLDSSGKCIWEFTNEVKRGRLTPDGKHGPTSGGFYNSPLVTDDHVFAADTSGFIYCLDQASGDLVWKVDTRDKAFPVSHSRNQTMGAPILANGKLIVVGGAFEHDAWSDPNHECCTGRGFVVALSPAVGNVVWSYVLGEEPKKLDPPVVIEDTYGKHAFRYGPSTSSIWSTPSYDPDSDILFFGTDTNNSPRQPTADNPRLSTEKTCAVVAIDASTGEERWVTQLNPGDVWNNAMRAYNPATGRYLDCSIGDTPKIFHVDIEGQRTKVVGVGCKNGAFYVLHASDGRIFQYTPVYRGTPTDPPSPTPDKRMLAFPGPIGGLQTGCATDGKSVFVNGVDWLELSVEQPRNGRISDVAPPTGGRVTSISLDTRTEYWRSEMPKVQHARWPGRKAGDPVASGVAVANGVVYFTTLVSDKLLAADASTGKVLFEWNLPSVWSGPSISRGHVYVGSGSIFTPEKPEGGVFCFGL